jgi:hypothetical protein
MHHTDPRAQIGDLSRVILAFVLPRMPTWPEVGSNSA